jgi:glycosyltransferase involved in cell wall biosynthesis
MLGAEALAFSRRRKRIVWALSQRRVLMAAACFHATALSEAEDIRRAGLRAPVAVISNGIDIPDAAAAPGGRTILHLGRLHPKKGIDRLIAAWARVAGRHPDWRLRIVGPSELGCREALERQVWDLRVPRVDFDGPLFGEAKLEAYRQAGLFVLPTLNENFGMVVAEALAAGVPTISTKGAPWQGLETERCGWWVDHGPDALAVVLDAALSMPDAERAAMGARGRAWMARDFGWDGIAARMVDVYAWCLGQGDRPNCVVTA